MKRGLARPAFHIALGLPGALMVAGLLRGDTLALDLLHPSGELSVRLIVAALLPGPLAGLFGPTRFLTAWLRLRRDIGLAAFGYAVLHLVFYTLDIGVLAPMLDELGLPSIWTGWLSLLLMALPAAISSDAAMRALGRARWKAIQRQVYAVFVLALAHWLLLAWDETPPMLHALPVVLIWTCLVAMRRRKTAKGIP